MARCAFRSHGPLQLFVRLVGDPDESLQVRPRMSTAQKISGPVAEGELIGLEIAELETCSDAS